MTPHRPWRYRRRTEGGWFVVAPNGPYIGIVHSDPGCDDWHAHVVYEPDRVRWFGYPTRDRAASDIYDDWLTSRAGRAYTRRTTP